MKSTLVVLIFLYFSIHVLAGNVEVTKHDDVVFATIDGFELKTDIYVPQTGKESYPVLVIWHGGGWLINDEKPMDAMSEYVASHGEYVVCNMNYRLLVDQGNTVTLNQMVEDVFGGLLWVKYNISGYSGDPNRIAITGDSAGGHLATMVLTHGRSLESDGFEGDSFGYNPSWLPEGKTAEAIAAADELAVQAAVISYGAFDMYAVAKSGFEKPNWFWQISGSQARGFFGDEYNADDNPKRYKAASPLYAIPEVDDYELPPQFHHVGTLDQTTSEASIRAFVSKMESAGQEVSLHVFDGYNHAYLDGGCNDFLKSCFETHAIPALELIIPFLDAHLK